MLIFVLEGFMARKKDWTVVLCCGLLVGGYILYVSHDLTQALIFFVVICVITTITMKVIHPKAFCKKQ